MVIESSEKEDLMMSGLLVQDPRRPIILLE